MNVSFQDKVNKQFNGIGHQIHNKKYLEVGETLEQIALLFTEPAQNAVIYQPFFLIFRTLNLVHPVKRYDEKVA